MKSGEPFTRISIDLDGAIMVTGADGEPRGSTWAEISPDSIIGLHRTLVKNPRSELERLRRHECAIAFDWLAGNRERALIAASTLSDSSPAFKLRWQAIAAGLPAQSDFK